MRYTCKCNQCGQTTSTKYATANGGKCKSCATGVEQPRNTQVPTRNERILESGYAAYAREEGHYA